MAFDAIKLYHHPATRSARARWALLETLGENFTLETIDLYSAVQYEPAFLQKNPNHNVPVLEVVEPDGAVHHILESGAIIAWLADAFPTAEIAPLAHSLSVKRADYLQMLFFATATIDMVLWQIRLHEHVLPEAEREEKTIKRYRQKFLEEIEPQLRQRLTKTHYICGDNFTAADILITHNVLWAKMHGMCTASVFDDYLKRMYERPAFLAAFDDAEKFTPDISEEATIKGVITG